MYKREEEEKVSVNTDFTNGFLKSLAFQYIKKYIRHFALFLTIGKCTHFFCGLFHTHSSFVFI